MVLCFAGPIAGPIGTGAKTGASIFLMAKFPREFALTSGSRSFDCCLDPLLRDEGCRWSTTMLTGGRADKTVCSLGSFGSAACKDRDHVCRVSGVRHKPQ